MVLFQQEVQGRLFYTDGYRKAGDATLAVVASRHDVLACPPYWKGPDSILGQRRFALLRPAATGTLVQKIFFVCSLCIS